MAVNLTLSDVTNLTNSSAIAIINANADRIETEFDKLLYADGRTALTQNLDVNGKRILNSPIPVSPTDLVRLQDIDAAVVSAFAYGGQWYLSLALGEAATVAGQKFAVVSGGLLDVYLRTAGVSTLLFSGLTRAALDAYAASVSAAKTTDFPSVKDAPYLAKGDNVTNDTAALASAIAASPYLRWPAGTYLVDSLPSPATGARWVADGAVTIKRRVGSTALTLVTFTGACQIEGITFDGNKAANPNACNVVTVTGISSLFEKCKFLNAKVVAGGYGSGLMINQVTASEDSDHCVSNCEAYGNDVDGVAGQNVHGLEFMGNTIRNNGGTGLHCDNYDLTFSKKLFDCRVSGNYIYNNTTSGIYFGNSLETNVLMGSPIYGLINNYESYRILIENNICRNNGTYGIAAQGFSFNITNNICNNNSALVAWAGGILLNAYNSIVSNNTIEGNKYGIDAGGSAYSVISTNFVISNTVTGINCGGSQYVQVQNNLLTNNGGSFGAQIDVQNVESDANGVALPALCNSILISNNTIGQTGTNVGVLVLDGCTNPKIINNHFTGADPNRFLILIAADAVVKGNVIDGLVPRLLAPSGGGILSVPEVLDMFYTASATTITSLDFYTANTHVGRTGVGFVAMTAGGTGYSNTNFAVTFTGGGGTGALAQAYVRNGVVIGVRMTNFGTGYTSAPTPVFTAGLGTGATGTATVSVPLSPWRDLEIYTNAACTINRAGTPLIENKGAANLTMAIRDSARLKSFFGQWNVMARAA